MTALDSGLDSGLTPTYKYTLPSGAEIEIQGLADAEAGAGDVGLLEDVKNLAAEKGFSPLGEFANEFLERFTDSMKKPVT